MKAHDPQNATPFDCECPPTTPRLGINQRGALAALVRNGFWSPGCGWTYGEPARTLRIFDRLVVLGFVATEDRPGRSPLYVPTAAARAAAALAVRAAREGGAL